jgi:aspartyl-tRNA(Asn)/glutamyl-tRNA(Gln) amidotransferase subunit B
MIHELLGQLTLRNETFAQNPITAQQFGEIIDAVEEGRITGSGGKILLRHLLAAKGPSGINSSDNLISKSNTSSEVVDLPSISPFSVSDLILQLGLTKTSSISDLDRWCDRAISEMPVEVEKYQSGKRTVIMALVGRVMKLSKGSADAIRSKEILESKLGKR